MEPERSGKPQLALQSDLRGYPRCTELARPGERGEGKAINVVGLRNGRRVCGNRHSRSAERAGTQCWDWTSHGLVLGRGKAAREIRCAAVWAVVHAKTMGQGDWAWSRWLRCVCVAYCGNGSGARQPKFRCEGLECRLAW